MPPRHITLLICLIFYASMTHMSSARPSSGPIRILFLGHDLDHHHSNLYYPMLAKALGRDAIYFDYITSVEQALNDTDFLNHFDVVLLYANHSKIESSQWKNLKIFIENGDGFVPVHSDSACFDNEPEFDQLVGGRFTHHKTSVFKCKTITPNHTAVKDTPTFEAWDETYVHKNHNEEGRTVLQVRDIAENDNITKPEPWTWVRNQGKSRVFTPRQDMTSAYGKNPNFMNYLKTAFSGLQETNGEQVMRIF